MQIEILNIILNQVFEFDDRQSFYETRELIGRVQNMRIIIYSNDHNPPHFKVKYNEYEASILIENGNLLNGYLTVCKYKLVQA